MTQNLIKIVEEHLSDGEKGCVQTVKLRIGELAGVVPESLEFCFNVLVGGTRLEGSTLEIECVPIRGCCNVCGTTSTLDYGLYSCPSCGSYDLAIVSGTELEVVEISLHDNVGEPS